MKSDIPHCTNAATCVSVPVTSFKLLLFLPASNLPCTEDVPVCGDTCELLLACGHHSCTRRCHSGPCETCRQMVSKRCRCGKREKSIQCAQEFICDIKCSKLRNCQRHQCRRKVCLSETMVHFSDGELSP